MRLEKTERQSWLGFMVSFEEHQTRVREMQDKINDQGAENEKLKAEIELLKHRLTNVERLIEREKQRAAGERQTMQARIDQIDDMCAMFAPRSMLYRNNAVVHALALARWPNEDDRPADFDEVVSINDGYQEFGVDYVRY